MSAKSRIIVLHALAPLPDPVSPRVWDLPWLRLLAARGILFFTTLLLTIPLHERTAQGHGYHRLSRKSVSTHPHEVFIPLPQLITLESEIIPLSQKPASRRRSIPLSLRHEVLTESGYRCAVPTCRSILALDLHHIVEVKAGGPNTLANLLALCPTCHALYTRGIISHSAINAWKTLLVSFTHAFDHTTIDVLLFLQQTQETHVLVSGDGVLSFAHLIATGLASYQPAPQESFLPLYLIRLTPKGSQLLDAWCGGNREALKQVLTSLSFSSMPE